MTREAGVPGTDDGSNRWSVDHVFLDQDGVPTLVEVKRGSDTRIRREVVGQMLDYAANAVAYWRAGVVQAQFEKTCEVTGAEADTALAEFLLSGENPNAGAAIERFWQTVDTNLKAGRVRLVFVADVIPLELRRVVEFLNAQMNPAEVLAIEIRQFVGSGVKTLVPTVIGQTVPPLTPKDPKKWDPESFLAERRLRKGDACVEVAQRILNWSGEHCSRVDWGSGGRDGSLILVFVHNNFNLYPFTVRTNGRVIIQGRWLGLHSPFDSEAAMQELAERLNQIPSVKFRASDMSGFPSFDLLAIVKNESMKAFLAAMEWMEEQIESQ